jgi:hypothetical protein
MYPEIEGFLTEAGRTAAIAEGGGRFAGGLSFAPGAAEAQKTLRTRGFSMANSISSAALLAVSSFIVPAAAMSATYEESVLSDLSDGSPTTILDPSFTSVLGTVQISEAPADYSDAFQMTLPSGAQTLSYLFTAVSGTFNYFQYRLDGAGFGSAVHLEPSGSGTIALPSSFAGTFLGIASTEDGAFTYSLALVSADVPAALLATGLAGLAAVGAKRKRAMRRG